MDKLEVRWKTVGVKMLCTSVFVGAEGASSNLKTQLFTNAKTPISNDL